LNDFGTSSSPFECSRAIVSSKRTNERTVDNKPVVEATIVANVCKTKWLGKLCVCVAMAPSIRSSRYSGVNKHIKAFLRWVLLQLAAADADAAAIALLVSSMENPVSLSVQWLINSLHH